MIGKPEWFTYRIAGWGILPRTKEGWGYIAAWFALALIIMILPFSKNIKAIGMASVLSIVVIDSLHIMTQLPKVHDERQNYQQLIIERNASFAGVASIAAILLLQIVFPGILTMLE